MTTDAQRAISSDLAALQRERRRHFAPAWFLSAALIGGIVTVSGRPDLLEQSRSQLAAQMVLWLLSLVLLPAIGLGMWFPSRIVRRSLLAATFLLAMYATTGWPWLPPGHDVAVTGPDHCAAIVLGVGAFLVVLGFVSGAFVQRRRSTAVYWIGGGLSLGALDLVTWICPDPNLGHVLPSHFGGAALLLGLAIVVGFAARRRG